MRKTLLSCCLFMCVVIACKDAASTIPLSEKRIIIASKQTVKEKDLGLEITNNGCGRKWISEGENPAFERPYCELVVKHGSTITRMGDNFEPVIVGDFEITIDKMNPWGVAEDSVPAGGCRLRLRKVKTQ